MLCRTSAFQTWAAAVALAVAPLAARAQATDEAEWNHFGVDFRLGLNIKAKFSNIGAATSQPAPPTGGGVDHTYTDGFVRVDSSGDHGGLTWNWAYQNASQAPGNDTLLMHTASTDGATSGGNDNPRLGFEADYARDLAHFGWGRWGIKLTFGYTDLNIRDSQPLNANVSLITDAYALGGVSPPLAPYTGSFSGPGPVIGDTPTRTTTMVPGGALITGSRQMDAILYDLRLGPYFELPLVDQLTCQVGGGLAVGLVDSTFSFSDTTTTVAGAVPAAGGNQQTDAMVGFYAEAGLAYQIMPEASLFTGAQLQCLGEFNQSAAGREAQLDLRRSIFFVLGVQWHF
jgi:hypothetical protein